MSKNQDILFGVEGSVGRITLNRPHALNALTPDMCAGVLRHLRSWADDSAIAAVLVDAMPGRAFCAGGDIRAVWEWGRCGDSRALEFFATEYRMNAAIARFSKPYVALLDGIVMGGGAGLSVHGAYRVATENTVFAMPETAIGFFPDVGASYFLNRCPGATGMYLALTGTRLGAADMMAAGLATHVIPAARLSKVAPALARGTEVGAFLATLGEDPGRPPLAETRGIIDRAFSAASVEEIMDRLEQEGETGAAIAAVLADRSPTSLKLAHRELLEARAYDLEACLRTEYRIAARVLQGHDFYEGVCAALVDKDRAPVWRPSRLDEVSDAEVSRYFLPLRGEALPLSGR